MSHEKTIKGDGINMSLVTYSLPLPATQPCFPYRRSLFVEKLSNKIESNTVNKPGKRSRC